MPRVLLVALLVALAGCAAAPTPPDPPARDAAAEEPVELVAPTFFAPVSLGPNGRAGEPTIAVGPDGTVYVAAAPQLWRSEDGRTFEALGTRRCALPETAGVCPPGYSFVVTELDGFGGGDAAVGVDAAGTVYFLGLDGESGWVPFHRSHDRGVTWSEPFDLAEGNASDRQWMVVRPDGVIYATWRDFGPGGDGPDQMLFRRSPDGGASWEPLRVIGPDTDIQGPLAYDAARGALYTPFYDGGLRMARSLDEGVTWTHHDVHLETRDMRFREGRPLDMFPAVAVDDAGVVYLAWAADAPDAPTGAKEATLSRVWLSASLDGGETWTAPRAVSSEGRVAAFPSIVAGKPGRVALTWYEGRGGTPSHALPDVWDVALVQSVDAHLDEPTFVGGVANREPVHVGPMCRSGGGCVQRCTPLVLPCAPYDRSRSELFGMALREGFPILAWVDDAAPATPGIEILVGGVEAGTPLR